MIKFEVYKETNEFQTKHNDNWTEEEIIDMYYKQSFICPTIISSFNTEEEARKLFEEEKQYCQTKQIHGNKWWLLIADVLRLEANEYDDEEEFAQAIWSEDYAKPINFDEVE